ncbi:MAG: FecR domain-containing protein [Flavisolibacter sp.]|jgi:ferric-dicitrate binding protein FerR (iron transport regulator)
MNMEDFKELLDRYLTDTLSIEERKRFAEALEQPQFKDELEKALEESFMADTYTTAGKPDRNKRLHQLLQQKLSKYNRELQTEKPHRIFYVSRWMAAAVLLLVIGSAAYFFWPKTNSQPIATRSIEKTNDILPGREGAILSLSDGTKIVLDNAKNGALALQGNVQIVKQNGQILYKGKNGEALYNNISTERGRMWSVALSDGTKVWLNAESSLHYPLTFTGSERLVEMTGEAYFEVAHNASMPFKVKVGDQVVEVLGTHFNINAYANEPSMRTTLLEGLVRISKGNSKELIHPNEEAAVSSNSTNIQITKVDAQDAIAWKNGYFSFHNADLKTVMRQLSRWYDIDVVYENNIPHFEFEGAIDRSLNLSAVLRILEKTRVQFKIEDKKLIILP